MGTHLLRIAVIVDRVVEVVADDENEAADHHRVEDFINEEARVDVSVLVGGCGL